eukprot:c10311_g1_i3.p1 GENE.c10311_g1_i3~~c10311_g1_i3.p1  ORF type:complete len:391 (-),score=76.36 c10311_g1_i3:807-1928(-)
MSENEEVLYRTFSICSKCAFAAREGLKWHPGFVSVYAGKVWLVVDCPIHSRSRTMYCSDPTLFKKTLAYSKDSRVQKPTDPKKGWVPEIDDIEEIISRLHYRQSHRHHLPLVAGLDVYVGGRYLTRDEIDSAIEDYRELYGQGNKFILKLNARLATKLMELNDLVEFVARQMEGSIVLVEASYERLLLLCRRENSAFLRPHVFPALRVYIARGEEPQAKEQIVKLIAMLEEFRGIEMAITINVDQPYPNLTEILAILRNKPRLVRTIFIENERMSENIRPQTNPALAAAHPSIAHEIVGVADMVGVFKVIEDACDDLTRNGITRTQHLLTHTHTNINISPPVVLYECTTSTLCVTRTQRGMWSCFCNLRLLIL